jgi:hypothetical protein
MSRYLNLTAVQRPLALPGKDPSGRHAFSFNIEAESDGRVDDWPEDVRKLIVDAGLGMAGFSSNGTSVIIGYDITEAMNLSISLIDTGGSSSRFDHRDHVRERLSLQVLVRSKDRGIGYNKAISVHKALDGKRSFEVAA